MENCMESHIKIPTSAVGRLLTEVQGESLALQHGEDVN